MKMKIKKKILTYVYLLLSAAFLIFSIYYMGHHIFELVPSKGAVKEIVQVEMGNVMKEEQVMNLIKKYKEHPEVRTMIQAPESMSKNYDAIKNTLGLENFNIQKSVMTTNIGCSMITFENAGTLGFKWANKIENGTIRFVIKDIRGVNVYENKTANLSIQDELELPAGDYFVFVEWNAKDNLEYNLFCTEK